ncbi:MAG: NB-ARC domain-containing protein [Microcoleaceae cyanobacterium]
MNRQDINQRLDQLTARRREILEVFLAGKTDEEIAKDLNITKSTVRKHIQIICKHFQVKALPGSRCKRYELIKLFQEYKPELLKNNKLVDHNKITETTEAITSRCDLVKSANYINTTLENNNHSNLNQRGIWIPNSRCRNIWGRNQFVNQLLFHLNNPQEVPILALCGSAGYGKTEVAREVAKIALKNNIFDDVLWIKAREIEFLDLPNSQYQNNKLLDWDQFIDEIAHQLNGCSRKQMTQQIKAQKILIVFDNAETAQIDKILSQLIEILNPSRALITSRIKTTAPYINLIDIQGLDKISSFELIQDEAESRDIPILKKVSQNHFNQIHQLSCGAPLALHFIIGRIQNDRTLEPVLSALEAASGDVEKFYEFSLKIAWDSISEVTKNILRYLGDADASITWEELSYIQQIQELDWNTARQELKRWYLLEDEKDVKNNIRYNIHPWVRRSLRSGLIDRWQSSFSELEHIIKWMLDF